MRLQQARPAIRWTVYVAVAVVFAVACAFLADWQFSRNEDRSRQLALIEANYDAPPAELAELIPPEGALSADDEWRPVALRGEYVADETLLVRNRPHGGTAAFEVIVPFRLDDGRIIAINRGWVPPGQSQADPDDVPAPPAGAVTVIARLKPGEPLPSSGRSAPEGQLPTIHLPLVAQVMSADGPQLEVSAYGIMASETPAPPTRPNALTTPSDDPGPHLSYAIQWILFAVMGFVFIWYVIRSERQARLEDAEDAATLAAAASAARDRDMQDEDAILDRAAR